MGAISPLDQSSLSFEYNQDIPGLDGADEYSLFSEYLSPLNYDSNSDSPLNASASEDPSEATSMNEPNRMQLFASVEESKKDPAPKLFADEKPEKSVDGKKQSSSRPESSKKGQVRHASIKNNANLHGARQAVQTATSDTVISASEKVVLSALKENVKSILNGVQQKTSTPEQIGLKHSLLGKKAISSNENVLIKTSGDNQKSGLDVKLQQSTQTHLAMRANLKSPGTLERPSAPAQAEVTNQLQPLLAKNGDITQQGKPVLNKNEQTVHVAVTQTEGKKSNRSRKSAKAESKSPHLNNQHLAGKDVYTSGSQNQEKTNSFQTSPDFSAEHQKIVQDTSDTASHDAESNNLLSKGHQKSLEVKSNALKTRALSRNSRALNWLRTLSERTSMLDKTNPQWKVLEMKLEKGNGTMTVKVMKEADHVSVAVNFSEPEVKALAEAQYNQILENLEEQYNQEVRFSFNDREQSPYESFTDQRAPLYINKPGTASGNTLAHEQSSEEENSYSNKEGWIG